MYQKIHVRLGCGAERIFVLQGDDLNFTLGELGTISDEKSPNFGKEVIKTIGYHGHLKSAYLSLLNHAQLDTEGDFAAVIRTVEAAEAAILAAVADLKATKSGKPAPAALAPATVPESAESTEVDDLFDWID